MQQFTILIISVEIYFKKIFPNAIFKCRVSKLWDISPHYFSTFLQNVLSVSVLIWYIKCFIGLRKMLRLWEISSFTQELLGAAQPPKIEENTVIVTLSKFVPTPLLHNSSLRKKRKKEKNIHQHQRAVCTGSNISCSMTKCWVIKCTKEINGIVAIFRKLDLFYVKDFKNAYICLGVRCELSFEVYLVK